MGKCLNHPGRKDAKKLFGEAYCKECVDGIAAAVKAVDKHVEPKECFVWYAKNDDWEPIEGTGCAHWIAHELNQKGSGANTCLAGYPYRVKNFIAGFSEVKDINKVKAGDIYVKQDKSHVGLVIKVDAAKQKGGQPKITIKHDSSRKGGVSVDEFADYFDGKGSFRR